MEQAKLIPSAQAILDKAEQQGRNMDRQVQELGTALKQEIATALATVATKPNVEKDMEPLQKAFPARFSTSY